MPTILDLSSAQIVHVSNLHLKPEALSLAKELRPASLPHIILREKLTVDLQAFFVHTLADVLAAFQEELLGREVKQVLGKTIVGLSGSLASD